MIASYAVQHFTWRCRVSQGYYEKIIASSLYWEKGKCGGRVTRAEIGTVIDKKDDRGRKHRGVERRALRGDY